jgi:very-short-patch-repair endonuclease
MAAMPSKVALTCVMCGEQFLVWRSRALRAGSKAPRYCGKGCANAGQKLNRPIWNAGKSKSDDVRLAAMSESTKRWYRENPDGRRGTNHPMHGKRHTAESLAKMSAAHAGKVANDAQRAGLAVGWQHRTGHTKATLPSIARGAAKLSVVQKGRANPKHAAWARAYYAANPDKHVNRILASRGHETGLERTMRLALEAAGIPFQPQHPAGRHFIDFAIPEAMLAVEVDGTYWHTPERDARRDAALQALGWTVLHFSEDRVTGDVHGCIAELLQALEDALQGIREPG